MHPATLREILLVKAIEEADRPGQLVPWGERERAARDAMRAAALSSDEVTAPDAAPRVLQALSGRAARLLAPLQQRYPVLHDLLARSGWPHWTGLALLLVALVSGYGLSAMNDSRRINILAPPFLGLLAWNVVVYVVLAIASLPGRRYGPNPALRQAGSVVRNIGRRLGPLVARTAHVDTVLGDALKRFVTDWSHLGAPVLAQQMRQWLHLAAAALALGLVLGLYQRGIGHDFIAGWESLWFDASQVQWLITTLFGPLARWAGITLPTTLEAVAQLQFRPDGTGGESARPWVHLIALLLMAMVVLPRLALAGLAWFKARWLQRASLLPPELAAYARRVLGAGGQGMQIPIRVIPYAFAPSTDAVSRLEPALQEWFGRSARSDLQAPIAYGEEASLVDRMSDCREGCVLLMNLAATPELENHGRLVEAARAHQRDTAGAPCVLLIDEESYAVRFGADAASGRLDQRRQLWREFALRQGLDLHFLAATSVA